MSVSSAAKPEAPRLIPLANVADLNLDALMGVNVDGVELVLMNTGNQIRAFEGRCPHMGTLLAEGELEKDISGKDQLVCRAHQWRFDCETGYATGKKKGDKDICLVSVAVQISDGQVTAFETDLAKLRGADSGSLANPVQHLPGPRPWPVVGSLLSINRRAFHLTLESWAEQYGPLYKCRLGRLEMVVVSDATIANALLKARPDTFRRSSQLETASISGMNTQGIFMAEGDRWRKQRPVIMQSLDTRHLQQFFPLLVTVTERLCRRWSGTGGKSVDVQSDLMRFTVDVTTSLAFGQDTNTLESEGDIIQEHLDKIFPTVQRRLLTPFPYWHYFRLPADRDAEKSVQIVYQAVKEFVAQAKKTLDENLQLRENPQNLLQSLLVAVSDEHSESGKGKYFSEREVTDNVMTMLLAGEDTTANSLAWVIYFLVKHPDIQDQLRTEIDMVLVGKPLSTFAQVKTIPYLDGVIHESMRLKPVAPLNVIEANVDFSTEGLSLKKGAYVGILTRAMAMKETDFADAASFRPERWLTGAGVGQINQRAFIPFGSGPRLCPGRSLALLEMKLVLVMIMQNFIISPCVDLDSVKEEFSFTMNPHGLKVSFHSADN